MYNRIHYGEIEGLDSIERWSCSRGASYNGIHFEKVEGLVSIERWSCSRGASYIMEYIMRRLRDWSL